MHAYFFGITPADQVAGAVVGIVCGLLGWSLRRRLPASEMVVAMLLVALPAALHPAISSLILVTDLSWVTIYFFVSLTVAGAMYVTSARAQTTILVGLIVAFMIPFRFETAQFRFFDRVEEAYETRMGSVQVVRWKQDYWLYYNDQLQFSTLDKHMYQEAYVQPIVQFLQQGASVLLIGGDNGIVESELSKFPNSLRLTRLPYDSAFYRRSLESEWLSNTSFPTKEVLLNEHFFHFLSNHKGRFDAIIIDMPDPINVEYKQYYQAVFYDLCFQALNENGLIVSQTGDAFKNKAKVKQVEAEFALAGFASLPYVCQIPTIGHWSWVLGAKSRTVKEMRSVLSKVDTGATQWWNQDAMNLMMYTGNESPVSRVDGVPALSEIRMITE